jgi:hypothetical protein
MGAQRQIVLAGEMIWKIDPAVEAASKLPHWARFHRLCGAAGLCFDHISRSGREYRCVAFRPEKNKFGGWVAYEVSQGAGKSVLDCLCDALAKAEGYDIPEAAALLAAGLTDAQTDEFEELLR